MKKIFLFLIIVLLTPFRIYAAKISDVKITGETNKKIGETVSVDFDIKFSELEKGYDKTFGIWFIGFKIHYDEEILKPIYVFSEHFMSDIYIDTETQEYYVLSEAIENSSGELNCAEGLLYCGDYSLTVKFFVDKTDKDSTEIKINDIEVGFLDMVDDDKTYTIDDLIELDSSIIRSHTININQTTQDIETPKETIMITEPKKENNKITVKEEKKEEMKSSNSLLKSIEIPNYQLNFDKNKNEYIIYINQDINQLDLKVKTEDSKATYKIIGAEDLKNNDYEISIEVTAEDNSKNIYKIKVEQQKQDNEVMTEKQTNQNRINKNIFIYISIALSIIVIIIIIVLLVNKKRNKYIDKYLDNL